MAWFGMIEQPTAHVAAVKAVERCRRQSSATLRHRKAPSDHHDPCSQYPSSILGETLAARNQTFASQIGRARMFANADDRTDSASENKGNDHADNRASEKMLTETCSHQDDGSKQIEASLSPY